MLRIRVCRPIVQCYRLTLLPKNVFSSSVYSTAIDVDLLKANTGIQLKSYLETFQLPKSGKKDVQIDRLLQHFQSIPSISTLSSTEIKAYQDFFTKSDPKFASTETDIILLLQQMQNKLNGNEMELDLIAHETEIKIENDNFQFSFQRSDKEQIAIQSPSLPIIDETKNFIFQNPIKIQSCANISSNPIIFESSRLAHLADGSVVVCCKGTMVMSSVVMQENDSFDLKVEAQERSYARGFIPSGIRRDDSGITEYEVLISRMIDRSFRPFLDLKYNQNGNHAEIQIVSQLLSSDDIHDSRMLAINATSAALYLSNIADEPIAAISIAYIGDQFIANPTKMQRENSSLNMMYVGIIDGDDDGGKCVMVETDAKQISDEIFCNALKFAQSQLLPIINAMKELKKEFISFKNCAFDEEIINDVIVENNNDAKNLIISDMKQKILELYSNISYSKSSRNMKRKTLEKQFISELKTIEMETNAENIFYELERNILRTLYLENDYRCDGRSFDDIRDLHHMIDVLPAAHGSSIFERGNTQCLCFASLGSPQLSRMRDLNARGHPMTAVRLYFQYDMPPFATNEIKKIGQNRRAQGHGALAAKALVAVLPTMDDFPYSLRIFSTITASDGSSSMASVCAASLALMDAGVPMETPVAGISIGLITDGMKYKLMTDIIGLEDHFGDMDLKIAGTKNGITAVQMDTKLAGVPLHIMCEAVYKACAARMNILQSMNKTIEQSNTNLKMHAPRVDIMQVAMRDMPRVLGSGGYVKRKIIIDSECDSIEFNWEKEEIEITAPTLYSLQIAKELIHDAIGSLCRVGDICKAKVLSIQSFGVLVQIDDKEEHFIHNIHWQIGNDANSDVSDESDIDDDDGVIDDHEQHASVNMKYDAISVGDMVDVLCIGLSPGGKPVLSRKAATLQISADPEDRARLQLMMQSMRTPSRSGSSLHSYSDSTINNYSSENIFNGVMENESIDDGPRNTELPINAFSTHSSALTMKNREPQTKLFGKNIFHENSSEEEIIYDSMEEEKGDGNNSELVSIPVKTEPVRIPFKVEIDAEQVRNFITGVDIGGSSKTKKSRFELLSELAPKYVTKSTTDVNIDVEDSLDANESQIEILEKDEQSDMYGWEKEMA